MSVSTTVQKMNVVIDCDTGVDDAMALLLALRSPKLNILGITNVAGNVGLDKVVRNTLVVVEQAQRDVPVYRGASHAMLGGGETAEHAHGSDGLGDVGFPDAVLNAQSTHAVEFLVDTFMNATEPVHLITLGPLTNVGLAMAMAPEIEDHIASLVMMAGSIGAGNVTSAAEFNVYVDPEAADIVFRSSVPKTMVGLIPIRRDGGIWPVDVERLEAASTSWCDMIGRLLRERLKAWGRIAGEPRPTTPPDLAAMAIAIDPTIAELVPTYVVVETTGDHTRGMTHPDQREFFFDRDEQRAANVNVTMTIDNDRYRALVLDTLLVTAEGA